MVLIALLHLYSSFAFFCSTLAYDDFEFGGYIVHVLTPSKKVTKLRLGVKFSGLFEFTTTISVRISVRISRIRTQFY